MLLPLYSLIKKGEKKGEAGSLLPTLTPPSLLLSDRRGCEVNLEMKKERAGQDMSLGAAKRGYQIISGGRQKKSKDGEKGNCEPVGSSDGAGQIV